MILLAIVGPTVAPYEHDAYQYAEDGGLDRLSPPSSQYLLGTTESGQDVLSRLLYGARPTLITGFLGGAIIISIGTFVGITAGYIGGTVDSILMRFTDFVYGVPLIPTAIVLVAFFGIGFWSSILIIGLLLWRGNARVFRSETLKIKQRPYVRSAEALGASQLYIIIRHIIPNLGGMIVLFFALGVGISILISASLAFLGVMSPFIPSWGIMLRNAYSSGYMGRAWWWSLPPGIMISLTVLATFLLGRGYERTKSMEESGIEL